MGPGPRAALSPGLVSRGRHGDLRVKIPSRVTVPGNFKPQNHLPFAGGHAGRQVSAASLQLADTNMCPAAARQIAWGPKSRPKGRLAGHVPPHAPLYGDASGPAGRRISAQKARFRRPAADKALIRKRGFDSFGVRRACVFQMHSPPRKNRMERNLSLPHIFCEGENMNFEMLTAWDSIGSPQTRARSCPAFSSNNCDYTWPSSPIERSKTKPISASQPCSPIRRVSKASICKEELQFRCFYCYLILVFKTRVKPLSLSRAIQSLDAHL